MNNNLPQKTKDNFFTRIITKIRSILFKSKENIDKPKTENDNINQESNVNNFRNKYEINLSDKVTPIAKNEKENFLQMLSDKPELLDNFSIDRLKIILKEYQEINEEKRKKIKKYGGNV